MHYRWYHFHRPFYEVDSKVLWSLFTTFCRVYNFWRMEMCIFNKNPPYETIIQVLLKAALFYLQYPHIVLMFKMSYYPKIIKVLQNNCFQVHFWRTAMFELVTWRELANKFGSYSVLLWRFIFSQSKLCCRCSTCPKW